VKILTLTGQTEQAVMEESMDTLRKGGIIAYPTESFYALGVNAIDEDAVRRVFELKGRPVDKPLPLIVGDMNVLKSIVREVPSQAEGLILRHWPGPLTLIFNAIEEIPVLLTAGTGRIAVRMPGHGFALTLAKRVNLPITATSANPSSLPPATKADGVRRYFGEGVDLIVDAGETPGGRPSTIVDVTVQPPRIIRQGRLIL